MRSEGCRGWMESKADEAGCHCPGEPALAVPAWGPCVGSPHGVPAWGGRLLRLSCLRAVAASERIGQQPPDSEA